MSQISRFYRTFEGISFVGSYSYFPGERMTFDHPGSPAEVFINDIMIEGSEDNLVDVLKPSVLEYLEQLILDEIEGDY